MPAFTPTLGHSPLREAIRAMTRAPEPSCVQALMADAQLPAAQAATVNALALRLAEGVRRATRQRAGLLGSGGRAGLVQGLLQEFALSSQEGVALMCLAEALLRIPDAATRDALIRDKISRGDWRAHLGHSSSPFVNAAAWGLLLTGQLVSTHSDARLGGALKRVLTRGGEPLVRKGVDLAMRLMGEQFVTGQTIEEALRHAGPREARGFRFSYDMLGEAALTEAHARAYLAAYEHAIDAIGLAAAGRGIVQGPGISIKLSALHPRYSRAQAQRVMDELYPRLLHLAQRARQHDIGLNIDAEESERLDLSLDLLERLCFEPSLAGWNGVGFVIQAYGKRCPAVIAFLVDLARRSQRRMMVRLVKGAYWDTEIKRTQLDGLSDYPVYTRKAHTDVAYLACARQLLAAPDAIYPQFATHNAHTLAAVHEMAGPEAPAEAYEFQCLHGMGETLYEQVVAGTAAGGLGRPCRIYAPVGTHETLLAYLVRRLLENGANTSFVNRVADESLALAALVEDPVQTVGTAAKQEDLVGAPHPAIPYPADLYRHGQARAAVGAGRLNAAGLDLADEATLARLGPVLWADRDRADAAEGCAMSDATIQGEAQACQAPARKRAGPLYLLRLLAERPDTAARQAVEASGAPARVPVRGLDASPSHAPSSGFKESMRSHGDGPGNPALQALSAWAQASGDESLTQTLRNLEAQRLAETHSAWRALPRPTGEANLYAATGREKVLCLADDEADLLTQLATVLAAGGQAVWSAEWECSGLHDRLPARVREAIVLARDWRDPGVRLDAALHHGHATSRQAVLQALAQRPGPIVTLTALNPGERRIPLERLWLERSLSINTAAAGGNASLMTLGEG